MVVVMLATTATTATTTTMKFCAIKCSLLNNSYVVYSKRIKKNILKSNTLCLGVTELSFPFSLFSATVQHTHTHTHYV